MPWSIWDAPSDRDWSEQQNPSEPDEEPPGDARRDAGEATEVTLKEVRKRIQRLRKVEADLVDKEWLTQKLPTIRSLVGQAFVYRNNSYGCESGGLGCEDHRGLWLC